ncbi:XdhC family protein [Pluralibacter gergoviae]|uniref:XdhC family protein n=1 Tax=Pluralibacter gergoviae TaxID=61647 RepID=UPI003075D7CC
MQSLDSRVVDRALSWLTAGKTVWLCTVLHSWGSAPRAPGAMLVPMRRAAGSDRSPAAALKRIFSSGCGRGAGPAPASGCATARRG